MEDVDHPTHYQGSKIEVIDVIEDFDLGFLLGNVIKYVLRAGYKDDRLEDLQKAQWYLNREIKNEESRRQIGEDSFENWPTDSYVRTPLCDNGHC